MSAQENRITTRQEEKLFLTLFGKAVEIINNERVPDFEIEKSIQKIIDCFRENRGPGNACSRFNLSSLADFLGFFYRYSPLSAGVTRSKILAAIEGCEEFKECFYTSSLKVVNVGGGAGSDLVGFYSAICKNSNFEGMQVTLIDQYSEWEEYFQVVNGLLREEDFGDASFLFKNSRITTSFVTADLNTEITRHCAGALKEASLVWMKGFLSTLVNDSERYIVTKRIISSMSSGALLAVMDSPSYNQFDAFIERGMLREIFIQNEGRYSFSSAFSPKYCITLSSNQEIFIFKKI